MEKPHVYTTSFSGYRNQSKETTRRQYIFRNKSFSQFHKIANVMDFGDFLIGGTINSEGRCHNLTPKEKG